MANLKNITELPVAESAEGLNLIVNDNGAAKQIAASAVGAQADFAVTDETSPAFIKNKPEVAQADWNQNDSSAPDYVKNRTHWVDKSEVIVLEGELKNSDGDYYLSSENEFESFDGQQVSVTFNNEHCDLILRYDPDDKSYMATLPNDTVLCAWTSDEKWIWECFGKVAGTITITIIYEIVHKLDAKYLPVEEWDLDIVITQVQDAEGNDAAPTWVVNSINTFENIKNKILSGVHPTCKCQVKMYVPTEDVLVCCETFDSMFCNWGVYDEGECIEFAEFGCRFSPFVRLISSGEICYVAPFG